MAALAREVVQVERWPPALAVPRRVVYDRKSRCNVWTSQDTMFRHSLTYISTLMNDCSRVDSHLSPRETFWVDPQQ
eukprot:5857905-Pleurochrysis_carterae.AAC.6